MGPRSASSAPERPDRGVTGAGCPTRSRTPTVCRLSRRRSRGVRLEVAHHRVPPTQGRNSGGLLPRRLLHRKLALPARPHCRDRDDRASDRDRGSHLEPAPEAVDERVGSGVPRSQPAIAIPSEPPTWRMRFRTAEPTLPGRGGRSSSRRPSSGHLSSLQEHAAQRVAPLSAQAFHLVAGHSRLATRSAADQGCDLGGA